MATDTEIRQDKVLEAEKSRLAPPPMYQVVMLNDDYTPMEFVVAVLQQVFFKQPEEAVSIMLKVHHEGRAVCGVYPYEIAETRVDKVSHLAQAQQHPLQCILEPAPEG